MAKINMNEIIMTKLTMVKLEMDIVASCMAVWLLVLVHVTQQVVDTMVV
jgi:hypothetical protein